MFSCNEADFKPDSDGDRARKIWRQERGRTNEQWQGRDKLASSFCRYEKLQNYNAHIKVTWIFPFFRGEELKNVGNDVRWTK